ncbi:MAG: FKBP-type peptidyl-prolyl cis-trans isomerase [Bacteroidales bacterium]|jgi:FKBP-type peptidyl-prolyl cis-trans isomerase SlyD|nr:FKBP-type peptidyl-prolyl cis-trans isomerase [Bacteroidales bacterium]
MVIEKDKMVSLKYVLREGDSKGDIVEEVNSENPLEFLYGAGQMLPHFESNIENLSQGDKFEFSLTSEQAYGDKREELIVELPMSVFEVDGKVDENLLKPGNQVPMADAQGRRLVGTVLSNTDTAVKMDFNHPMAGAELHFTGEVLDVRDASPDELNTHKSDGCSGCGSHDGCSGC